MRPEKIRKIDIFFFSTSIAVDSGHWTMCADVQIGNEHRCGHAKRRMPLTQDGGRVGCGGGGGADERSATQYF